MTLVQTTAPILPVAPVVPALGPVELVFWVVYHEDGADEMLCRVYPAGSLIVLPVEAAVGVTKHKAMYRVVGAV